MHICFCSRSSTMVDNWCLRTSNRVKLNDTISSLLHIFKDLKLNHTTLLILARINQLGYVCYSVL